MQASPPDCEFSKLLPAARRSSVIIGKIWKHSLHRTKRSCSRVPPKKCWNTCVEFVKTNVFALARVHDAEFCPNTVRNNGPLSWKITQWKRCPESSAQIREVMDI